MIIRVNLILFSKFIALNFLVTHINMENTDDLAVRLEDFENCLFIVFALVNVTDERRVMEE